MRLGFVGPSYTASSTAIADEECINFFMETVESQGAIVPISAYGGKTAKPIMALRYTPGLSMFTTLPDGPVRGQCIANNRYFAVGADTLYEIDSSGNQTARGFVYNDGNPVQILFNSIQLLIISGGHAFSYILATDTLTDQTSKLSGVPLWGDYSDSYCLVMFANSNKFQISQVLDVTTWPGLLVNEVSVFSDNINGLICNHREPWVFGLRRSQPYQDTGSAEVFDVIPGTLIEKGCVSPFVPCRVDNSVFWVDQDERGAYSAWRSNGYTPQRISTHAVEIDLGTNSYANLSVMTSYSYQDQGHLFWVLYVPNSQWSWVYDVTEGLWHKRAFWNQQNGTWQPHFSWNHCFAFGMNLVGDWNSGNIYQMSYANLTDNNVTIRRDRRAPTVLNEMQRLYHAEITLDFDTGLGPQPPLTDGNGNPRPPQVILRWSNDRGKTWSNDHILDCGFAGEYRTRVIQRRLGQSRYRVYEMSVSDPIPWYLVDAYLRLAPGSQA